MRLVVKSTYRSLIFLFYSKVIRSSLRLPLTRRRRTLCPNVSSVSVNLNPVLFFLDAASGKLNIFSFLFSPKENFRPHCHSAPPPPHPPTPMLTNVSKVMNLKFHWRPAPNYFEGVRGNFSGVLMSCRKISLWKSPICCQVMRQMLVTWCHIYLGSSASKGLFPMLGLAFICNL